MDANEQTPFATLAPLEPLMDKCVHCGFCLPTCPSYLLLGKEMDSPRGRIYTMRAGMEGRVDMSAPVVAHFDTCLGCMACETACPSGVKYAPLIEETRAAIEAHHPRPLGARLFRQLLFAVLPYHRRLRVLGAPLGLARALRALLPARLQRLIDLAPRATLSDLRITTAELTPARGEQRLKVGLLTGCVQRAFFGSVNEATVRVLAAEGCTVHAPRAQGCCGALALHAGEPDTARRFARALITVFEREGIDAIAVNAAGCGSSMKEYGHLLRDDPAFAERATRFASKVKDVTEILTTLPARVARKPMPLRIAYHDACHLGHAQGVRRQPRELLQSIPGVTLLPVAESDICCGSAGIFNLVQPEMSDALGARKAAYLAETGPDMVVTSNPGCILQIQAAAARAGTPLVVRHIVEVLDEATRGM